MKYKFLALFSVLLVLGIVFLANTGGLPQSIRALYDFPFGDKLGHLLLMGLLSFAVNFAILAGEESSKSTSLVFRTTLVLVFLVTLEEFSQRYFYRRTFSLMDLFFSYLGIFICAFSAWKLQRYVKKKN